MKQEINQYLLWKATYAPRASVNYRPWLIKFACLVDKPVKDITIDDVMSYRRSLSKYSSYTIQFAMVAIKNFLRFQRMMNVSCLSPDLIKLKHTLAKSYKAIPEEEYSKLIALKPRNDFFSLRDYVIIRLLHDTGMRVSELCDLNVSDINDKQTSSIIFTKKTTNKRMVVWSDKTHEYLVKYLSFRSKAELGLALFLGRKRRRVSLRLSCRTVERIVKDYLRRVGAPDIYSPHSFRHARAHMWRDNGAHLSFIQKGLGHNHPISSFHYLQYEDKEFKDNAKRYLTSD